GFSPLDGLVMGTRAGSMDVSAATYIANKEGMTYAELDNMLNKKSGVQGLTGISSDMRDIDAAYDEGNERAIIARDMYSNRIKKFIGEYAAEMGGVDLVVFTGGVGENSPEVREYALQGLEFMGLEFDAVRNRGKRGTDYEISKEGSRVKAAVICTDEELVIAKDTYRLVK
ncbi:MAG: acetate kinase, partial [Alistipes sp.]|nr:acetate kinase [Alistipes sp.]